MLEPPSRRLIGTASRYNFAKSRLGVALADVSHIPLNQEMKDDILACLKSNDWTENVWGLFFCHGFVAGGRGLDLGVEISDALIKRAAEWIAHAEAKLRLQALPLFVSYRSSIPQFEYRMCELLRDPDSEIRALALQNAETFLSPDNINKLFPFQTDACTIEDPSRNQQVYILRNMALEAIERILKKKFSGEEKSEVVEGIPIFWRDWNSVLRWWQAPWRRWQRRYL